MAGSSYMKIAGLKTADVFRDYLLSLEIDLPFDEKIIPAPDGPLAQSYPLAGGKAVGNRFCVLPMEGWDGTEDGYPTELTRRRWRNFGRSGAKLIWGGEAAAVRYDGRGNPNQLIINSQTMTALDSLRRDLLKAHSDTYETAEDLLVGLQLTHSGRFSRPNQKTGLEPKIAYHHPFLDPLFGISGKCPVFSDGEIEDLTGDFIQAAVLAGKAGFDFVDVKHCHGYFGHELLSARTREGKYGGNLENRSRFAREIIDGIRKEAPGLMIGVRLSVFDFPPFRAPEPGGQGHSLFTREMGEYPYAFGVSPENPLNIDLREVIAFISMLQDRGVELICVTAGSPYYNPHIQRPALYPPSDGYLPPEDPLAGVARQLHVTAELKKEFSGLVFVGSAYTYLQEWLPNVAQGAVRAGMTDFVGLGRMMLSYPEMAGDVLRGNPLNRKKICRTFSHCTTAPRKGFVSGCYPLDPFYKSLPEARRLSL